MSFEDDLATLSLNIDRSIEKPLYLQLAEQIRGLIYNQRLVPGEQLPSSRKLAELLAISRTSTLNAYDQLVAEGLLITRPSSGIFVSALGAAEEGFARMGDEEPSPPAAGDDSASSAEDHGGFDAGPDVEQFPFSEWSRSLSRVWKAPDPQLLRNTDPGGYVPLRQAVARYVKAVRDIDCRPEQVIITAGSRDALALIAKVLLQAGDRVALEDPCYRPLRHGLEAMGATLESCRVDDEGMTPPGTRVSLAWMTPARQYPLGVTMSTERRLAWLDYSGRGQCWLVEDDYDSEFQYRKAPLASLFSMAAKLFPRDKQQVILVGSFSKVMFSTLRIGYLIVPESLTAAFLLAQRNLGNLASVPVQPALADFLGHRRFSSHLRLMRRCYQQRRDFLHAILAETLETKLVADLPDCGMHLLARFRCPEIDWDDVAIEQRLAEKGVYAPALSAHFTNGGEQGLLLGFSGVSEDSLKRGVRLLTKLCN
ncbi:MAG: GntR family transcriptional regulator/MocR family aminotransferase [Motiliproteus sp.]|jgi:GntR family transcriptional regulator/MocR family aminotransferase